jgi:dihydroflavonol-4-reductase
VRALVRDDTRGVDGLDVETIRADVLDPAALRGAFDGVDVVYHLAARITIAGDPDGNVTRTNIEGPRNVVSACLDARVKRLVHFSSIHALSSSPTNESINENRPLAVEDRRRLPIYDRTKSDGQREIFAGIERGLDAVIIYPTAILGPYDYKQSAAGAAVVGIMRGELPALVDGGFNWVDVRDVVNGALAAEKKGRAGESYLLCGEWRSVRDLAGLIGEVTGVAVPRIVTPWWLARMGVPFITLWSVLTGTSPLYTADSLRALRNHRNVSCEKAREELGYSHRPLRETLEVACEWYQSAGIA